MSGRDDDWLLGQIEQTHRIMGIEIGVSGASECGGGWERAGVGECVHRPATISSVCGEILSEIGSAGTGPDHHVRRSAALNGRQLVAAQILWGEISN